MKQAKRILLSLVLIFASATLLNAQDVTGTVVDQTGEAVIGATVMEKGTKNGTVTDFDGRFKLKVKTGQILVFSYVGFQTSEVPAANGMKVTMQEDAAVLNEVVVTGYTSEKKADLTGSVSVVKMDDIADVPTGNVLSSLNGRVAGMNITTNGTPGGGVGDIRVRGITTVNKSGPLYVIDGIMTRDDISSILSSNDVESIQVLKDASSAAIYGAQAANGVIIITTKRAKKGETHVTFDASLTLQTFHTNYDLLNAQEWGDVYWQAYKNTNGTTPSSSIYGNGEKAVLNTTSPYFIGDDGQTYTATDTDWLDVAHRSALMQNYSLTLSKGSENGSSSLSLNWIDQDGIVKKTDYQRFNARITSDYSFLNNHLRIGESVAVNRWTEHVGGGVEESLLSLHPAVPVYSDQGGWGGGYVEFLGDKPNPMRLLENYADDLHERWRVFGNAFIEIVPIKNLTLKSNFGINYFSGRNSTFEPKWNEGARTVNDNKLVAQTDYALDWVWTNTANYALDLGSHQANFLLGYEAKRHHTDFVKGEGTGFDWENTDYRYLNALTSGAKAGGLANIYSMTSLFAKASYSYESKYLAAFTIRRDASSRFGQNNNSGVFPSVSAGWRISSEKFMEKTQSWLDDLKLRVAWGVNGNDEMEDNYAIYSKYLVSLKNSSYNLNGDNTTLAPGVIRTYTGNHDLKWEQTTQTNIGIDAAFLGNRLTVAFDYFHKRTTDMLHKPPYAAIIGEGGSSWTNCLAMNNNGFELVLGWRDRLQNGLNYDISLNASAYRNKITDVPDNIIDTFMGALPGKPIVGQPINSWMGYKTEGLFRTQQEVDDYRNRYDVRIGDPGVGRIRYKDIDGNNIIDENDRTWLGSDNPKLMAGLNLSASYKGFDLSLFFNAMFRDAYNNSKFYNDFFQLWSNGNHSTRLLEALNAYEQYEQTGTYTSDIPALTLSQSNNEGRLSEYFIENASFLKLKTATLGYTLPKKLTEKAGISRARIYVQAQNIFTITSYTGADPEVLGYNYPLPRTFTFGLSVGL